MDPTGFFLLNKFQGKEPIDIKEIIIIIAILPLITYCINFIKEKFNIEYIRYYYEKLFNYKYLYIEARENLNCNAVLSFTYSESYLALCWYLKNKNINNYLKCINKTKNNKTHSQYYDSRVENQNEIESTDFVIDRLDKYIIIDVGIEIKLNKYSSDIKTDNTFTTTTKNTFILRSINVDLQQYITNIIKEYNKYVDDKNKNKTFHFIYQGKVDGKLKFSTYLLNDLITNNNETFDNLFNEHSSILKNDIKRLKDFEYYRRTGMKRKKGYLFHGEPGTGKTSTVMAISNEDKRHIMEISLTRVKTNNELEEILNLDNIDGIKFKKDQLVLLFDEIDRSCDTVEKKEEEKQSETEKGKETTSELKVIEKLIDSATSKVSEPNKLDLSTMLSRLDGIGNYNGLIIIATTNNKDKLDPALYRELRLSPMYFTFCRKQDIIEMTEQFYNLKLSKQEKLLIPDRNSKISPAKIRLLLEQNEDNIEKFIDILKPMSI